VSIEFETQVATPQLTGEPVLLELDLVSEGISWFAEVHGHPIEIRIPPYSGA
jgi:hypothetical protein